MEGGNPLCAGSGIKPSAVVFRDLARQRAISSTNCACSVLERSKENVPGGGGGGGGSTFLEVARTLKTAVDIARPAHSIGLSPILLLIK